MLACPVVAVGFASSLGGFFFSLQLAFGAKARKRLFIYQKLCRELAVKFQIFALIIKRVPFDAEKL